MFAQQVENYFNDNVTNSQLVKDSQKAIAESYEKARILRRTRLHNAPQLTGVHAEPSHYTG